MIQRAFIKASMIFVVNDEVLFSDKSQLLLCGEPVKRGVRIDQAELQDILKDNRSPRCLPNKDILLYTGMIMSYLFIPCI